jgi:N6-adenosine-specific RNA methylase IME4
MLARFELIKSGPFAGLGHHHYRVGLADPAWHYATYSAKGTGRSACQHYDVMSFEQIAALPVRDLFTDDAWMFLWVLGPHLPQGFKLLEHWGLTYSGLGFVWAKQNKSGNGWHMGMGFTTRANAEICLLAKYGKPKRKAADVRELIVAPRRKHSRKPDEQYGRIERFTDDPYLELFACQQWPGWTAWGDEIDRFGGGA